MDEAAEARELIRAEGLRKSYTARAAALQDVDFSLREGEIVGVAGLNGAGKSTLLAILAGALAPDGGRVLRGGVDIFKEPARVVLRVGYVPQEIALFPELSVRDNLKFWALAARAGGGGAREGGGDTALTPAIQSAAAATGLSDVLARRLGSLSGGMKRRANIAAALVADPDILILDEPTAGLDMRNRREVFALLQTMVRAPGARPLALALTTHEPGELSAVADRVLLLAEGRRAYLGPPSGLAAFIDT